MDVTRPSLSPYLFSLLITADFLWMVLKFVYLYGSFKQNIESLIHIAFCFTNTLRHFGWLWLVVLQASHHSLFALNIFSLNVSLKRQHAKKTHWKFYTGCQNYYKNIDIFSNTKCDLGVNELSNWHGKTVF